MRELWDGSLGQIDVEINVLQVCGREDITVTEFLESRVEISISFED